ncbi:hypothetical protein QUF76_05035 [Desulfobacterales bacterium HSG16]|nr:hypothetical protein [Desulfobacterales bacterium HSG16]
MFDYSSTELQTIDDSLQPKMAWAKERRAFAEQLALDSTRILACTEDRLDEYKNQGFFKRCWSSLTGKTGEMQRANQNDLIEMQKTSWRYLELLNKRDLLLAHSVIMIKNNLMTLAVKEEETRESITRLADRVCHRFEEIEERVANIEVTTNIHNWLLTIEVNEYDEKYPKYLRLLCMVRDFNALKSENWNIKELKCLQQGLIKGKLPWKEEISIKSFIDGLIDEIEDYSFDKFDRLISLKNNNEETISNKFIIENIASPSFNCIYQIRENYGSSSLVIEALQDQLDIEHKDAIKMVIHKFIQKQGVDVDIKIPLKDLAIELLCCMKLSSELFNSTQIMDTTSTDQDIELKPNVVEKIDSEEHSIDADQQEGRLKSTEFTIDSMLSQHISVSYHVFTDTGASQDECNLYLDSLSLIVASTGYFSEEQHYYISALANALDIEDFSLLNFKNLVSHPNQIDMKKVLALLNTRDRQFAWLMDAVFLGASNCGLSEEVQKSIIAMGKALNLKQDEVESFISHAVILSTETDPSSLFSAAKSVYKDTFSWKTIFDFRKVSIEDCFEALSDKLSELSDEGFKILIDTPSQMKIVDIPDLDLTFSDMYSAPEIFILKRTIPMQRAICISEFKKYKRRVEGHESAFKGCLSDTNSIMRVFGTPSLWYRSHLDDISADEVKSASNNDWADNMGVAYDKLGGSLSTMSDLTDILSEQIKLYSNCCWNESAVEKRKVEEDKRKVEEEEKRLQKKETYSAVQLNKEGESVNLHIEWTSCKAPFPVSDVRGLSSDGEQWIALVDGCLYSTFDGKDWEKRATFDDLSYSATIKVVNSTWLLIQSNCFWFSIDGRAWEKQDLPENRDNSNLSLQDIFFDHSCWVMSLCFMKEYSYTEKFLMFDTMETSYYDAPRLYRSSSLEGKWELLTDENAIGDGIEVKGSNFFYNGELYVAACEYGYSYLSNKHIMRDDRISLMWSRDGKSWKAEPFSDISSIQDGLFLQQGSMSVYVSICA